MSENAPKLQPKQSNNAMPYSLWGISVLVILVAIAGGLKITGGPGHQRAIKMDDRREEDLRSIEQGIAEHYTPKKGLPDTLKQLDLRRYNLSVHLNDPETHQGYAYQKLGKDRYKLCAKFNTSTQEEQARNPDPDGYGDNRDFAQHAKGKTCFIRQRIADSDERDTYTRFQSVPE